MSNNTSRKAAKNGIKNAKKNIMVLKRRLGGFVALVSLVTFTLFYAYAINDFLFASALVMITGTLVISHDAVRVSKAIRYERDRLSALKKAKKALRP